MKLNKLIFALLIGAIALSSKCNDEGGTVEPFSYENEAERYAKDMDSIEHYLRIHYVNDLGDTDPATYRFDSIPDGGGQTSLWDDTTRLQYITETEDADHDGTRIDYKIYYMIFREGVGQRPTYVDSVYTSYKGIVATGTQGDSEFTNVPTPSWLSLPSLVRGWHHTLPLVKAGTHTTNTDGTVDYADFGVIAYFLPSGVAYFERNTSTIPSYTPLIFQIELKAVKTDVDHDHDGILTIYEDLNGNEDVRDDNTDADQEPSTNPFPNYNDSDDDNDGHYTIDEGADPNGDGNPDDAEDLDNDSIPNYLDSDSY